MPSFSDSIVLFILALLLFGPKKLPVLARELGKWVGEFRRASNEFKMQMEEELRVSEQADRQQKIAAMEAAAPVTPALPADALEAEGGLSGAGDEAASAPADGVMTPLPIATSGELNLMPPSTGLPTPRSSESNGNALGGLVQSIPEVQSHDVPDYEVSAKTDTMPLSEIEQQARENALHGD
jgi:sec-independent protein translocase protein TatB